MTGNASGNLPGTVASWEPFVIKGKVCAGNSFSNLHQEYRYKTGRCLVVLRKAQYYEFMIKAGRGQDE